MPKQTSAAAVRTPATRGHMHLVAIGVAAATVLLLLLLVGFWVAWQGTEQFKPLGSKIIEIVVQTLAATVAGGLLVQAYLKWHSRELAINDFRRAILDSLIKEYMDAKRTRRVLRATSNQDGSGTDANPWTHVPTEAYADHMKQLNNTQLALEVLTRRIEVFAGIFPNATTLGEHAKAMHDYLADVIKEYERHRALHGDYPRGVPLRDFPSLRGFMLREDQSTFDRFAEPYHAILKSLQQGAVRVAL